MKEHEKKREFDSGTPVMGQSKKLTENQKACLWHPLPVCQVLNEHPHLGIRKMHSSWHLLPVGLSCMGREKEVKLERRRNHIGQHILSSMGKMGS